MKRPAKGAGRRKRQADTVGDLAEYNRKRDFKKTSEPAGGELKDAGGMFVVQKHAATRLHYDFRLEHRRRADELGGAAGPLPRSRREAPRRAHGEPPDRIRLVRGRDPEGRVWRAAP